jgi:hypothetical protein
MTGPGRAAAPDQEALAVQPALDGFPADPE